MTLSLVDQEFCEKMSKESTDAFENALERHIKIGGNPDEFLEQRIKDIRKMANLVFYEQKLLDESNGLVENALEIWCDSGRTATEMVETFKQHQDIIYPILKYSNKSVDDRKADFDKWREWTFDEKQPAEIQRLRKIISGSWLRLSRLETTNAEISHSKEILEKALSEDECATWP